MKNLIHLLLVFFGISVASAQDQKAGAILDAMSNKYKTIKSFSAVFNYGVENTAGKVAKVQNGSVTVKGFKFKLNIAGQDIYNNGKDIYTYVKDANEVNITEYDNSADSQFSPSNIYTIYKKGYKYTYKGTRTIAGKTLDIVELVPEKKNDIVKLELSVDKADKSLKSWKIFDKSGKKSVFTVTKFTPNVNVTDAFFTFSASKYPGVEIVDLR